MKKHPYVVKQSKRLNKEQTKKQLLESFVYNENITKEDLGAQVDTIEDYQEAMKIIKEYENIIKINKKNIILLAFEQGKIFKKFEEDRKFKNLVE